MQKSLSINYLINHVIYTIDNEFKDKLPHSLKNYLYLIVTGMILNYGPEYVNDIYNAIFSTNYQQSANPNDYSNSLYYINPTNHNYLEKNISFKDKKNIYEYNILYKEIDNSKIKTLEYLTYQLNHILFHRQKKISIKNNIKLKLSAFNSNFIFKQDNKDNILENVFNVIQVEEIIKNILYIDIESVENTNFKNNLLEYQNVDLNTYQFEGLDILANLFKPLYKQDKLKNIIDSYNNLELIKKELDSVLGKNTYKYTYNQLMMINNILNNSSKRNYYELSNYYVNIRNNIINRYINLKWT